MRCSKVLIADDEPSIVLALYERFKTNGYLVPQRKESRKEVTQ